MVNTFLKDLAILLFAAGEEIEKKTDEFKAKREKRYQEFSDKVKDKRDEFTSKYKEEVDKAKNRVGEFASNLGLATKGELDELKKMLAEINAKLDKKAGTAGKD